MFPIATDLNAGDEIPDNEAIARYCSPCRYDHSRKVFKVSAFIRNIQKGEKCLSFNRIKYYLAPSEEDAVACISLEMKRYYGVNKNGRFVVLEIEDIKTAMRRHNLNVRIVFTPEPPRKLSHCSLVGLPDGYSEDAKLATTLLRLAQVAGRTYRPTLS